MLQVTFVHHSCFVVELDGTILIFDYFPRGDMNGYVFTGELPPLNRDKEIYVFSSHSHKDHFSLEILKWAEDNPGICYILSKDIRLGRNYLTRNGIDEGVKKRITFVAPGREYAVRNIKIRTLRSTDVGVAYLVEAEGRYIYHAGDLNLWKWEGAGDLINGKETRAYRHEINKLASCDIDVAFVPLDSRQGQYATLGMDYFMKHVNARFVFPMHMWQDYGVLEKYFARISNPVFAGRIARISGENEVFEL